MVVQAKLFAPKGRTFLSVAAARVLRATDEHGANIPAAHGDTDSDSMEEFGSGYSSGREQGFKSISLNLVPPGPETSSIEELAGEVVALTAGSWKEQVIENPSNHLKAEIDLGALVPGTKCVLTKVNNRNPQQISLSAKITGPAESQRIELKLQPESAEGFSSHSYNSSLHSADPSGQVVRTVELQGYSFRSDPDGARPAKPPKLVIRMPQDLKQERVKFTLKGLDLL